MEKKAKSSAALPELIKQADAVEKLIVLDFDGYEKYASGHDKPGLIIVATGPRATALRKALGSLLE
jgi:hypothetical protein